MGALLAIIGGSGFAGFAELTIARECPWETPYGAPSAPLAFGTLAGAAVVFLPRHGRGHTVPPHRINYRANLWALKAAGCQQVIGLAAVGGIRAGFPPGTLAVPDQIIDYTYGRSHTFFDRDLDADPHLQFQGVSSAGGGIAVTHVDFTYPYCSELRQRLLTAGATVGEALVGQATYAAAQGPRLETAAEICRLERDGCDLVGMTGMPEAALARELDLRYACLAMVVNWAAGKGDGVISMEEIEHNLVAVAVRAKRVLAAVAGGLRQSTSTDL